MTERLLAQPLRKREEPVPATETPIQPETEQVRILVVEDNPKMAGALAAGLREQSYSVDVFSGGFEGEEAAASNSYDAIILDLMLPDRDGLEVCRSLRRRGLKAPILILSALSATGEKVTGLNAGADDYLTKPFEFEELIARLRALLRRGQATESAILRVAGVELDLWKRCARRDNQTIHLTAKEFSLLEYLMRNPERVLSRAQIGEHVWDMNFDPASNVIDVYISMLRRKIDKGFTPQLIHTIVGAGYLFSATRP